FRRAQLDQQFAAFDNAASIDQYSIHVAADASMQSDVQKRLNFSGQCDNARDRLRDDDGHFERLSRAGYRNPRDNDRGNNAFIDARHNSGARGPADLMAVM